MKVVLQDVDTLKFVTAAGGWTAEAGEARDFGEVPSALDYVLKHTLQNARVVLKGSGPGSDLELPPLRSIPVPEPLGQTEN